MLRLVGQRRSEARAVAAAGAELLRAVQYLVRRWWWRANADGYLRAAAERLAFLQQREGGEVSGPENLDFFTENSLVEDPYDYYNAIRRCPYGVSRRTAW